MWQHFLAHNHTFWTPDNQRFETLRGEASIAGLDDWVRMPLGGFPIVQSRRLYEDPGRTVVGLPEQGGTW